MAAFKEVDPALLAVSEIKEAVGLAEEAAYTEAELNKWLAQSRFFRGGSSEPSF